MARTRFGRNIVDETNTTEETTPVTDVAFVEPTLDAPAPEAEVFGTPVEVVADAATAEPTSESQPDEANFTPVASKGERKRSPRPAINVGEVIVRKSSRTDFTTRATPTENNPVFKAVKDAAIGEPTDILVDPDKIDGAISILRRAGAKLNLGMHIAPKPYETEETEAGTKTVLTFKTSSERQTRGRNTDNAADESVTENGYADVEL